MYQDAKDFAFLPPEAKHIAEQGDYETAFNLLEKLAMQVSGIGECRFKSLTGQHTYYQKLDNWSHCAEAIYNRPDTWLMIQNRLGMASSISLSTLRHTHGNIILPATWTIQSVSAIREWISEYLESGPV